MKSLTQFIIESSMVKEYGILLDHIEFKKIPSLDKLADLIKEGIIQANSRYKVLRIEAIEKLNQGEKEYNEERLKKALIKAEEEVIAYMQTKPGIMKRSEEKRQKYIQDKLDKYKASWRGPYLHAVEYDEKELRFAWHSDVHSEHGYTLLNYGLENIGKLASQVADDIDGMRKDKTWSHLTGINISVNNHELTRGSYPTFHILPMFDEETEETLAKDVRRFSDYMSGQYNSGKYMGD